MPALKHSYFEMIEDAILTLSERKGSSRQAIWRCVNAKYPEADYKQFIIRLKKIKENGNVVTNGSRWRLSPNYKLKLVKALAKG
jgi:hypothetical protein